MPPSQDGCPVAKDQAGRARERFERHGIVEGPVAERVHGEHRVGPPQEEAREPSQVRQVLEVVPVRGGQNVRTGGDLAGDGPEDRVSEEEPEGVVWLRRGIDAGHVEASTV